jgi:hypothetical protein
MMGTESDSILTDSDAAISPSNASGVRLEPDRNRTIAADKRANLVGGRSDAVVARDRRRLRQILLHQRRELEPRENVVQLRAIGLDALEFLEVDVDLEIALDPGEIARHERLVAVLLELLALRGLELIEVLVHVSSDPNCWISDFAPFSIPGRRGCCRSRRPRSPSRRLPSAAARTPPLFLAS